MLKRNRGLTLIEILVVIAVIAILSAIIFPSFSRARAEAYRNGDLSAMNNLRNAVLLYREDQGGFPPQLLGYATTYASGPNVGGVIPANRIQSYLFPRRVNRIDDFRPANNRIGMSDITNATYPNRDPRNPGAAPQYDLNGDGVIDLIADDPAEARQQYGPSDGCVLVGGGVTSDCSGGGPGALFYNVSGYDLARNIYPSANPAFPQYELRYTLFWTEWGLGSGNASDDQRQLGYNNPPDDTIITWNSWWRDYEAGNTFPGINVQPAVGKRDIVLTVGGSAKPADSRALFQRSWRYVP